MERLGPDIELKFVVLVIREEVKTAFITSIEGISQMRDERGHKNDKKNAPHGPDKHLSQCIEKSGRNVASEIKGI